MIWVLIACVGTEPVVPGGDGGTLDGGTLDGGALDGGTEALPLPLPWSEGFELSGEQDDLLDLGWWTPHLAFPGYAFSLSDTHAAAGSTSAEHLRGSSAAGDLDDWLISPALDLSTVGSPMLRFWERGAGVEAARHSLWLSTGSRDPSEGDFQQVAELAAPVDGQWGEAVVDLGAFAGQGLAYIAWRAQGEQADDWWIDELQLGERHPVFVQPQLSGSPQPAMPGETIQLELRADNAVDMAAIGLVGRLSLPEGGAEPVQAEASVERVEGLGELVLGWELVLDAELASPGGLPLRVELEGEGFAQVFELELRVGPASLASLELEILTAGTLAVDLGRGDPLAPELELAAYSGWVEVGTHSFELDLVEQADLLPPVASPEGRWFARLEGSATGSVLSFVIEHDGLVYEASLLPALEGTVQVPSPASPVVLSTELLPEVLAPGDEATLGLVLRNDGAAVEGPVWATLQSEQATVLVGGPWLLADGWAAGAELSVEGARFAVPADHLDSSDLALELSIEAGADLWRLPLSLPVPWPVLRLVGVGIEGDGIEGDGGDGLLDPGEGAVLVLRVGNAGDLELSEGLSASLRLDPDSVVQAEVEAESALGALAADEVVELRFPVQVLSGEGGESLLLELMLGSELVPVELVLGEAPWSLLSLRDDARGDSSEVDLVNGRWRVTGDRFELEVESAVAVDPETVFLEIWARPEVAVSYSYYRMVLFEGEASLDGYASPAGFGEIGVLGVEAVDEYRVLLSWSVADLDLYSNSMTMGLGAGWCGPPEYFCDHLPDGWGYPYVSWSRDEWVEVAW